MLLRGSLAWRRRSGALQAVLAISIKKVLEGRAPSRPSARRRSSATNESCRRSSATSGRSGDECCFEGLSHGADGAAPSKPSSRYPSRRSWRAALRRGRPRGGGRAPRTSPAADHRPRRGDQGMNAASRVSRMAPTERRPPTRPRDIHQKGPGGTRSVAAVRTAPSRPFLLYNFGMELDGIQLAKAEPPAARREAARGYGHDHGHFAWWGNRIRRASR